jgi:hypothetical protein
MVGYFQDHLNQWNKSMTKNVVGISGDMTPSDRNLKDNITVIPNALDKVKALSGNTFKWKSGHPNGALVTGHDDVGVIAQEVEALGLSGITSTRGGYKSVSYKRLIPIMLEAIKELSAKVDALS